MCNSQKLVLASTELGSGRNHQNVRTWSPDPRQQVELRWRLKAHKHSAVVGRVAHNSRPPHRQLRYLRLPSGRSSCRCRCCGGSGSSRCHVGASWGRGTQARLCWGPLGSWCLLKLQVESDSTGPNAAAAAPLEVGMCEPSRTCGMQHPRLTATNAAWCQRQ
jgi:hypothetical protein